MKGSLLKKALALSLGFFMTIGLTTSVFASWMGETGKINEDFTMLSDNDDFLSDDYCFGNPLGLYYIGGIVDNELNGDDFSPVFLNQTEIIKRRDGSTRIYNPYCNGKIMLIFTALYIMGYNKYSIIEFLTTFNRNCSLQEISSNTIEYIKGFEARSINFDLALDMILCVQSQ